MINKNILKNKFLMRNEKANIIRSILLNKINNEILTNLKKKEQMRINGKKVEDLYKMNCGNFEVCIIHKLTIGKSINHICKIRNASTVNLDLTSSIEIYQKLENLKELENFFKGKTIISEKKLKIIPEKKLKKRESIFINEKKKAKDGFLKLRKIERHLIKKFPLIPQLNIAKNNLESKTKFSKNLKRASLPLKDDSEFKIKLINMSHRGPTHHYKLENNNVKKKKKKINPYSSQLVNNKIFENKVKKNKTYRNSILVKNKLDLSKILNDSIEEKINNQSLLTTRTKKNSQLMLLYDDSS